VQFSESALRSGTNTEPEAVAPGSIDDTRLCNDIGPGLLRAFVTTSDPGLFKHLCNNIGPGRYRSRFCIRRPTLLDFLLRRLAWCGHALRSGTNTEPEAVAPGSCFDTRLCNDIGPGLFKRLCNNIGPGRYRSRFRIRRPTLPDSCSRG